jgi:hypothetical protein
MQAPNFWRAPNGKLYRIRRQRRSLPDGDQRYTVRAFTLGRDDRPAAEASVTLRQADVLDKVRLGQEAPTPEQLYVEAFQAVMKQLG